jgi:cysteine desulfurase/selenocysteine lyase
MTIQASEPRPTGEHGGSVPGVAALTPVSATDLPTWLPDEATLNRLAGEFFAGLPGVSPSSVEPVAATSRTQGGVEHAPRVDVPARSNEISQVPGDGGGSTPVTPVPPPSAPDLPGLVVDDPAAAGFVPARAVPDVSEAVTGLLGAAGLGMTVPEGPIVPGLTGLQLGAPGELTPVASTLAEARPDQGVPGLPESDQIAAGGGVPGGQPDATAGVPVRGAFGPPLTPRTPVRRSRWSGCRCRCPAASSCPRWPGWPRHCPARVCPGCRPATRS